MILILRNLVSKFTHKKNYLLNYSIDKQMEYLKSFSEPTGLIERSYYQYKCQIKIYGKIYCFFANFLSLFLLLPYVFSGLLSRGY